MGDKKHSSLPPSSAKMWINCNPSAKRNAQVQEEPSPYAAEGSKAHIVAENALRRSRAMPLKEHNPPDADAEMLECGDDYAVFVNGIIAQKTNPILMTEQKLDFSEYAPGGFGTGDTVIVSDGNLHIVDYKYGKGVPVSAGSDEEGVNPQLACYALGALAAYDCLYDIETVSMSIFQPRLNIAETYTVSHEALIQWGREVLAPAAQRASKGEGEYVAGDHCRFCKVKAVCRKRAEYNLEMARYDFAKPEDLEDDEVEAVLGKVDGLVSWANDVKEYALNAALGGKKWKDYKLVEGRSVRKYTNEAEVAKAVQDAGYDPYEKSVLGITAMTRLLGAQKFKDLLSDFVVKPAGRPTLASRSDKRKEIKVDAAEDFKEE